MAILGVIKTLAKISEQYYWKGMKLDVQNHCQACKKCFAANPKISSDAPPLNSIPVPPKVWSLVGIDISGPLQESRNGNKYIVAISNHLSKYTEAAAIPEKSAERVASFLYAVICHLGCPDTLISDQGREFVNRVVDSLLQKLQTEHRISSAYHPQTNDQREHDNKTLKGALSKLVNEHCDDWDELIPDVLFAYHTSVHSSTKCTPFEVMYGRKAKLPIDWPNDASSESVSSPECSGVESSGAIDSDLLATMHNIPNGIQIAVSNNIVNAQSRQKRNYDNRHNIHSDIPIGTKVYIKNNHRIHHMGSKLEPHWIGPYDVTETLTKGR